MRTIALTKSDTFLPSIEVMIDPTAIPAVDAASPLVSPEIFAPLPVKA